MNRISPVCLGKAQTMEEAALSRRSIRSFLPDSVSSEMVSRILTIAGTAPSGSNTQPWQAYVLQDAALLRVVQALSSAYRSAQPRNPDYLHYAQPLPDKYLARRRSCGRGLYAHLGIPRDDVSGIHAYRITNYKFFDAPVALIFTVDRALERGSWVDYGMFLQTLMLAARSFGLHTCAEGSIAEYPDIIREQLGLSRDHLIVCGMALGYADPEALVNLYQPPRCDYSQFTVFLTD